MSNTDPHIIVVGIIVDNSAVRMPINHMSVTYTSAEPLSETEKTRITNEFGQTFNLRMQMSAMLHEKDFSINKAITDTISIIAENNHLEYQTIEADACIAIVAKGNNPT